VQFETGNVPDIGIDPTMTMLWLQRLAGLRTARLS